MAPAIFLSRFILRNCWGMKLIHQHAFLSWQRSDLLSVKMSLQALFMELIHLLDHIYSDKVSHCGQCSEWFRAAFALTFYTNAKPSCLGVNPKDHINIISEIYRLCLELYSVDYSKALQLTGIEVYGWCQKTKQKKNPDILRDNIL